jgi:hypothetical protein
MTSASQMLVAAQAFLALAPGRKILRDTVS